MFCICLSIVSILYVCTGCFVLFVSCNKKLLECIFCHFHVVSLSLLGFFPCLIDGSQKWISSMQNLTLFDPFSKCKHIVLESFWETSDAALESVLLLFGAFVQNRLKLHLHRPECINMSVILTAYTVDTQARKFLFLRRHHSLLP